MTIPKSTKHPAVYIGDSLSRTFSQIQDMIRDRAYHIFLNRDYVDGDSMSDWLQAKSQILTHIDLELKEHKKNYVVEGDLKGFAPEEIEIELQDGKLRVSGSHHESSSSETGAVTESRSESINFYQTLNLPAAVDTDNIQVNFFKNGKLRLTIPKKTPPRAKKTPAQAKARRAPAKAKAKKTPTRANKTAAKIEVPIPD